MIHQSSIKWSEAGWKKYLVLCSSAVNLFFDTFSHWTTAFDLNVNCMTQECYTHAREGKLGLLISNSEGQLRQKMLGLLSNLRDFKSLCLLNRVINVKCTIDNNWDVPLNVNVKDGELAVSSNIIRCFILRLDICRVGCIFIASLVFWRPLLFVFYWQLMCCILISGLLHTICFTCDARLMRNCEL